MPAREKLLSVKLDSYLPLREIVFETLREAILSGLLEPGERLMEVQLAEELGVSRTPVREALRKLELEGFIIMMPRKGAYVADLTTKDIADVFEIRDALEMLAAGLACERITEEELEKLERLMVQVAKSVETNDLKTMIALDTEFHEIIYKASRNERLVQLTSNLREQIQRFRSTSLAFPGRMKEALAEHKKLVEAISARDVELAQQMAREHVENAEAMVLSSLESIRVSGK